MSFVNYPEDSGPNDAGAAADLDDGAASESEQPKQPTPQAWPTFADHLAEARAAGARVPLGIAALDELCRGGPRQAKCIVVGGAPGAGKTTLVTQVAANLARDGVAVAFLAIDEEPSAIVGRLAQSIGIPRDEAEDPSDDTTARVTAAFGGLPLHILDGVTVEQAFRELARLYPTERRAVIVDSLQSVALAGPSAQSLRERIDVTLKSAKRLARAPETRALLIFTSELARGAYRSKDPKDQTEDLAAFKESGGIEFGAHLAMVMRRATDDEELVHVNVAKNRLGRLGAFSLRLDFATATFSEDAEEVDEAPSVDHVDTTAHRQKIRVHLTGEGWMKTAALQKLCGGRRGVFWKALQEMIETEVVCKAHGQVALANEIPIERCAS